jgi:AraC-like DNA-binding protein
LDQSVVARAAGLSQSHLERLFTARYGITPRHFFERRRANVARQLIETTTAPIKEIAFRLGFSTLAHFSTWFRRSTGESPRQARSRPRRR